MIHKRYIFQLKLFIKRKILKIVQGLATIRAMRAGSRFQRDFLVKLEESTRAQLTSSAAQQWLGLRLQMLGAFLIGGSGFIAVITSADSTTPELTGLVISYTLSFVTLLSGVLNALTETEQVKTISSSIISVDVKYYILTNL